MRLLPAAAAGPGGVLSRPRTRSSSCSAGSAASSLPHGWRLRTRSGSWCALWGAAPGTLTPAHRRDGAGLAVLAAALVTASVTWWHLFRPGHGPGGPGPGDVRLRGVDDTRHRWRCSPGGCFGTWTTTPTPPAWSSAGRRCWSARSAWCTSPTALLTWPTAPPRCGLLADFVGYVALVPLAAGASRAAAAPLLALLTGFGVLVITGTFAAPGSGQAGRGAWIHSAAADGLLTANARERAGAGAQGTASWSRGGAARASRPSKWGSTSGRMTPRAAGRDHQSRPRRLDQNPAAASAHWPPTRRRCPKPLIVRAGRGVSRGGPVRHGRLRHVGCGGRRAGGVLAAIVVRPAG